MIPRVFLDTTVLKFAADRRLVLRREQRKLSWDGFEQTIEIGVPDYDFPNSRLLGRNGKALFRETMVLPCIAALAKEEAIKLITTRDVWWEYHGLPKTNSTLLYGAPIEFVHGPIVHQHAITAGARRADILYDFLSGIEHKRFVELQKATGAFQGAHKPRDRNQLFDAWHLWCAEYACADNFLTLDMTLLESAAKNARIAPKVSMIAPELLVKEIAGRQPKLMRHIFQELLHQHKRHSVGQKEAETEFFGAPLDQ